MGIESLIALAIQAGGAGVGSAVGGLGTLTGSSALAGAGSAITGGAATAATAVGSVFGGGAAGASTAASDLAASERLVIAYQDKSQLETRLHRAEQAFKADQASLWRALQTVELFRIEHAL